MLQNITFFKKLIKLKLSNRIPQYSNYTYLTPTSACLSSFMTLLLKLLDLFHFGFLPYRSRLSDLSPYITYGKMVKFTTPQLCSGIWNCRKLLTAVKYNPWPQIHESLGTPFPSSAIFTPKNLHSPSKHTK
jgi:hypothetical protein